MKIVVFGTDNSGKTTLCSNLSKILGLELVPPLGPKNLSEQIKYLNKYLIKKESVIFDRFPIIEEYCCGNVLRGSDNFRDIDCEIWFEKVDAFVFCNPGLDSIKNWGEREQMVGIKENIDELYKYYNFIFTIWSKQCYNVYEYNFNKESAKELAKKIKEDLIKWI